MLGLLFVILLSSFSFADCNHNEEYLITGQTVPTRLSQNKTSHFQILKKIEGKKKLKNKSLLSSKSQNSSYQSLLVKSSSESELYKLFPKHSVQKNCVVTPFSLGEDRYFQRQKWFFDTIKWNPYQNLDFKREVTVAVLDTGVDTQHEDLKSNIWTNEAEKNGREGVDDDNNGYVDDIYGYDVADKNNNPTPSTSDYYLDYDHGTHVAGLIAARNQNNIGVAGLTQNSIKIMAIKGFRSRSDTRMSDLLEGIYYAVDNGAQIINASWGVEKAVEAAELAAVNYATEHNVLVVAAAGNSNLEVSRFTPAAIPSVISVGSINSDLQLSTFSNYGKGIDFLAPGGDGRERNNEYLLSTALDSYYIEERGTSMAAPIVSGALALILALREDLNPFQALKLLKDSSHSTQIKNYRGTEAHPYKVIDLQQSLNRSLDLNYQPNYKLPILALEDLESLSLSSYAGESSSGGCGKKNWNGKESNSNSETSFLFLLLPLFFIFLSRKKQKGC